MVESANPTEELNRAVGRVLASTSTKKLIVAGPGAGKTFLFRKILEQAEGDEHTRLALTFINELKDDLESSLSDLAHVFTFHGYCHYLLRRQPEVCNGLSESFDYFPNLPILIKRDWEVAIGTPAPKFIGLMRNLSHGPEIDFYMARSDYYDAIAYDDSVYRVHESLSEDPDSIGEYDLILVDEYQDFNRLESSFIDLLASRSSIVIAGDDDQALYSQLRGSSQEFIRTLHVGGDYEVFELPFCMRCPEAVILAVNAIISQARKQGYLKGRIDKPFRHYAPLKGGDSKRYPHLQLVECSTQTLAANYFGKYIALAVGKIFGAEIVESHEKSFPSALVIGSIQYLRQIQSYLQEQGFTVDAKEEAKTELDREEGLELLKSNPESNLAWRIILETYRPACEKTAVADSVKNSTPLHNLLPPEFKESILKQAESFEAPAKASAAPAPVLDKTKPTIKLTSFEGSKGLSAQHVFVVGVHEDELPKDAADIKDLEICKFLVALTRTRKQCNVLTTYRFSGVPKRPSIFLKWIPRAVSRVQRINKEFWQNRET